MSDIQYSDHIRHYQKDAEFQNYFENNPFEDHNIKRRYAYIFKWLSPIDNKTILEVGSGGGHAIEHIKREKCAYVPLDIPLINLQGIKSKGPKKIYPVSGDAYKLPFKDNCFNAVIISEVLEHLQNPAFVLEEISRVILNDGLILVSVPYKEKISYQICVHCNQPTPTHAHFHSFDENSILEFTRKTDLKMDCKRKLNNKFLSRISIFLKINYLPFHLWLILDRLMNIIFPKPTHILFQFRKSSVLFK